MESNPVDQSGPKLAHEKRNSKSSKA